MKKFLTRAFIQSIFFLFLNISATFSSSQKETLIEEPSSKTIVNQKSLLENMRLCINLDDPNRFLLIDKIIELDKTTYEDSASWLGRLNAGFSLSIYKNHPLYFILEAAIAQADFESDNAEYILRLVVENKITDGKAEMYRKAANSRARTGKKSVEVAFALLAGKYTLEEYIHKHLISYFGYLVRTRTQIFTRSVCDDQLSSENQSLETYALQSANEALDLRFEIIRRIFEHMLEQKPQPLCEQLSEKTLTLLRLSPTLLKFLDRSNHFHLNYNDTHLAVEGRNFFIFLKKEGKNFFGFEIKDFFENQDILYQTGKLILQKLGASPVVFSSLPEFLCINKFYGSHVQSAQILELHIEKDKKKRGKKRLTKHKNINNSQQAGFSLEPNQADERIKTSDNILVEKLKLEQQQNGKEEIIRIEKQQTEGVSNFSQQLVITPSQMVQEAIPIPKNVNGKQEQENFISDENKLSSSNISVIGNLLEEEKKRNANKHMNKIWDLFGHNTFQTVSYDDIIKAWSYFNGEESVDVSTGSSHHPLYAVVNGKRKTFGIFRSKQSNGAYGSRYVKVLRDYFTVIGRGAAWLEEQGYKKLF